MKSTFSVIFYLKRQAVKKDGTVPVMGTVVFPKVLVNQTFTRTFSFIRCTKSVLYNIKGTSDI